MFETIKITLMSKNNQRKTQGKKRNIDHDVNISLAIFNVIRDFARRGGQAEALNLESRLKSEYSNKNNPNNNFFYHLKINLFCSVFLRKLFLFNFFSYGLK